MLGHFRLVVPEDTSTHEALALDATPLGMLPGMWWELLWRWWARLPASYTPGEKILVLGTSLFRKSFSVRGVPSDRRAGPLRSARSVGSPADM